MDCWFRRFRPPVMPLFSWTLKTIKMDTLSELLMDSYPKWRGLVQPKFQIPLFSILSFLFQPLIVISYQILNSPVKKIVSLHLFITYVNFKTWIWGRQLAVLENARNFISSKVKISQKDKSFKLYQRSCQNKALLNVKSNTIVRSC